MNFPIPVLAAVDSPEIYGEVSLTDPSIWDSQWVKVAAAALAAILALIVWLIVRRVSEKRLEKLRRDPLYILRTRLQSLLSVQAKGGREYYGEMASVMREIVGLRYKIGAAQKSARELRAALVGTENADLAGGVLDIVEKCETALFAGDAGIDADKLAADASVAFEALAPRGANDSKAGEITR